MIAEKEELLPHGKESERDIDVEESENMYRTQIPARLDRLPWSGFHNLIIVALGCSWVLDGLNVTIFGVIGPILKKKETLDLTESQVGTTASVYVIGLCMGSLFFGFLGDRFGRKRLFMTTPMVYLTATFCTAFSWDLVSLCICQFCNGFGVGGEYAAINSTIDEFIPARVRGTVDLFVMGTYWLGGLVGACSSLLLLDPDILAYNTGWRLFFGIGGSIGFGILLLRRKIPESPRWLLTHGRAEEAEVIVNNIEDRVFKNRKRIPIPDTWILVDQNAKPIPLRTVAHTMLEVYPSRTFLGVSLMLAQAFFYNAIFFTYSLVLNDFYDVEPDHVGVYLIGFCIGNFLGPSTLGRLFDSIGRVPMIAATYAVSGLMLAGTGVLFVQGQLTAVTQTLCWSAVFYIASSSASSAYLTVSEIFPLEVRAMAIALCYAAGTGIGGSIGPALFGHLIGTHSKKNLFIGYLCASAVMILAAIVELTVGIKSEGQALESIAAPISSKRDTKEQMQDLTEDEAEPPLLASPDLDANASVPRARRSLPRSPKKTNAAGYQLLDAAEHEA